MLIHCLVCEVSGLMDKVTTTAALAWRLYLLNASIRNLKQAFFLSTLTDESVTYSLSNNREGR